MLQVNIKKLEEEECTVVLEILKDALIVVSWFVQ
jgi:hypothetical protein